MKDESGKKYGRLLVLGYSHTNNDKKACFNCICDCGKSLTVSGKNMRNGTAQSCGCIGTERIRKLNYRHGACSGFKRSEYLIWQSMKKRCENPATKHFDKYGGRGIKVCKRWHDFSKFISDMGPRPTGMTIERINSNGDYKPSNCKWATMKEQNNNRRNNRILSFNGKKMTVSQWADQIGCKHVTLYMRLYRKWSVEKTLTYGFQ